MLWGWPFLFLFIFDVLLFVCYFVIILLATTSRLLGY